MSESKKLYRDFKEGTWECNVCQCPDLDFESMAFCPQCGTPILKSMVLGQKSTASYDPISSEYKPWRERPENLPERPSHEEIVKQQQLQIASKPRWCPVMNQSKRPQERAKSMIIALVDKNTSHLTAAADDKASLLSSQQQQKEENESLNYQLHPQQQQRYKHLLAHRLVSIQESYLPVAIYDIADPILLDTNTSSSDVADRKDGNGDNGEVEIHQMLVIHLYRQYITMSSSSAASADRAATHHEVYWLRLYLEQESIQSEADDESSSSSIIPVAYLSNAVGRLLLRRYLTEQLQEQAIEHYQAELHATHLSLEKEDPGSMNRQASSLQRLQSQLRLTTATTFTQLPTKQAVATSAVSKAAAPAYLQESDWVNLPYIASGEYYMSQHLQERLVYFIHYLQRRHKQLQQVQPSNQHQQVYEIEVSSPRSSPRVADNDNDSSNEQASNHNKKKRSFVLIDQTAADTSINNKTQQPQKQPSSSLFDDSIFSLPEGPQHLLCHGSKDYALVPMTVHVQLLYTQRIGSQQDEADKEEDDDDDQGKEEDVKKRQQRLQEKLLTSSYPTHLQLRLQLHWPASLLQQSAATKNSSSCSSSLLYPSWINVKIASSTLYHLLYDHLSYYTYENNDRRPLYYPITTVACTSETYLEYLLQQILAEENTKNSNDIFVEVIKEVISLFQLEYVVTDSRKDSKEEEKKEEGDAKTADSSKGSQQQSTTRIVMSMIGCQRQPKIDASDILSWPQEIELALSSSATGDYEEDDT